MKSPGHVISKKISHFFKTTGYLVYRHPAPFLYIPILLTAFSLLGLLRFYEENRIWYLYSPTGAESHREHAIANDFFNDRGGKFWMEVSVTARDMGNLLRRNYLDGIDSLSQYLQSNLTVPCDLGSGNCSFSDLCSGSCNDNQVVPIFNLIYRNASQRLHPNFRLTFPTMHLYNDEYYVGEHFAGVEINHETHRISSVKVMMLYFRTDRQNPQVDEALHRWESRMFDFAENFNHPLLNMTCNSDGMISKEVRRNGMTCMPFFAFSVTLVFTFIFVTNRKEHFPLIHNVVMAILGIAGPLMAVITTFCLLFLLGVPFNSITLVMPFLIIGVGSDDVFIIIHACRKTDKRKSLEEQIAETMEEAGPSITVTSATNILSFGIGIMTTTPAISLFCLYTCVGVAIDFVYQLTFFVAALVYEEKRIAKRRAAIERAEIDAMNSTARLQCEDEARDCEMKKHSNGIVSKYCRILKMWMTRTLLLLILIGYWAVSIHGCKTMEIKMDTTNLILKDSPLNSVKYLYEKYLWKEGQLVLVFVNNPPDVSTDEGQHAMFSLIDRFETLPYSMGKNSTSFWLRSFLSQKTLYVKNNQTFFNLLDSWLKDPENGGSRWNDMIRLDKEGNNTVGLEKFMFATGYAMGGTANWGTRERLQHEWRTVAKEYGDFNVSIFQAYSFYVDQLDSIGSTTVSTVILAAATMDAACFLMIPHLSSIITSTIAMASINIGVFGLLSMWGVNLDPITMCTTLMSIGFSVDFTAHISYHYYRNPVTWTTDERLADALRSIGWPMVQAGVSTIFCVSPLLLVDSYMILVFWKTIFLVILLGLLHGIIFLPALLLTVGTAQQVSSNHKVSPSDMMALPAPEKKSPDELEFDDVIRRNSDPKADTKFPEATTVVTAKREKG